MEEELIPYRISDNGEVIVSAKVLHGFLQVKTPLNIWMPRMIEYGFEENEDYIMVMEKYQTSGGVQDFRDYLLKADMAKEICMLQRSERGRQARLYFINLEKKFNSPEAILDRLKQLLCNKTQSYIENPTTSVPFTENSTTYAWQNQQKETTYTPQNQHNEITYATPGTPNTRTINQLVPTYTTANYNEENFSDLFTNFRDTAKIFGMKESLLIGWLILNNFCYRDKYNDIRPYAEHMKYFALRPFKSPAGHSGIQTLINSYGRDYFTKLLLEEDLIELEYTNNL